MNYDDICLNTIIEHAVKQALTQIGRLMNIFKTLEEFTQVSE